MYVKLLSFKVTNLNVCVCELRVEAWYFCQIWSHIMVAKPTGVPHSSLFIVCVSIIILLLCLSDCVAIICMCEGIWFAFIIVI